MGLHLGDAPQIPDAPRKLTVEEKMRLHADNEARLEVRSWFTGERYEWHSFDLKRGLRRRFT